MIPLKLFASLYETEIVYAISLVCFVWTVGVDSLMGSEIALYDW